MKLAHLKRLRVVVSLLFFLPITLLFFDFQDYYVTAVSDYVLYLQFLPSFVKFINLFTFISIGFAFAILFTLLFGRVYCSSVCPLGTFQDLVIKISARIKKTNTFEFSTARNYWRYAFLIITILFLVSGSLLGINLLDPYSSFGKIITNLVRPIVILFNNILSSLLEQFDNFSILPIDLKGIAFSALIFSAFVFVIMLWLSIRHGRLYCNTVCPVGTLLGLFAKFSLFKISVDENNCIACGECELVCKANCIDSENKFIDFSRCINCFNCFDSCPTNGLVYKREKLNVKGETRKWKTRINQLHNKDEKEVDKNRRNFIRQTALYTFGFSILAKAQEKIEVYVKNKTLINRLNPISPPGSKSIEHFIDSCTACHLCVSVCPTQVLQPSFLEYGFLGMMQPRMDNKASFCNYDCIICTEVCPSGAILPLGLEEKKLIQIGKAKFVKENCVVETQKTECGACAEHCPTKAVHMVPYNNIKIPEVNEEICVGCGACEFACPTIPFKAIYVEGNPIHQAAKKPEQKELKKEVDHKEEFPF